MAGIGCHGMAMFIPSRRTATITHMGAEGANWIGQAPFTSENHIFQNMGDGTYTHSGLLALRAAAAAGVNITYKILYNDAVAMTGGQPAEGGLTVGQIAHQVAAEGARRIAIVSDDPDKYPPTGYFPYTATVHHRRDLDAVQKTLREIPGLTALIYDQTCAAEKRRRRKRGAMPDPPKRLLINTAVCEGCGDCSVASNCISIQPEETRLGRKRRIDQSNCNKDFSCAEGFCPSFVTVHGGKLRRQVETPKLELIPEPDAVLELDRPYNILIAGIGGTGVITIASLLGMAAHLEGKGCTSLDFTGLAQKNGAVISHVRLAPEPRQLASVRIAPGAADVLIGCDLVVSASEAASSRLQKSTYVLINTHTVPTASFVINPDIDVDTASLNKTLSDIVQPSHLFTLDATSIAQRLTGDSIAANAFLLGFAYQKGLIPLSHAALMRAIELNGAATDLNKTAFGLGRVAAASPNNFAIQSLTFSEPIGAETATLDQDIDFRADFLTKYQNLAYSTRYREVVNRVRAAETAASPGSTQLARAFSESLFKLMAYKDEYEVARLHTDPAFRREIQGTFEGDVRLGYHLAPPLLSRRSPATGLPQKTEYGAWIGPMLSGLSKLKFLRATVFDPFGYTRHRKMERKLISDYEERILARCANLRPDAIPALTEMAKMPLRIRGYGHVKEKSVDEFYSRWNSIEGENSSRRLVA
jgi:indolepyruvate ferredoxin oxidoreductase